MQQPGYFTFGIASENPPPLDARLTLPRANRVTGLANLLGEPQTQTVLLTGEAGIGKSTLAAQLFRQIQSQVQDGLPGFRRCAWLRLGPRTTWPDILNALLNSLQATTSDGAEFAQRTGVQALYEALRRPGQAALVVLDGCEEMFERAVETQNQETPYAVGVGLSGAVRFLELLQQDLGESRVLLTCIRSPFGSQAAAMPGVREYALGEMTAAEGALLLQQRNVTGTQPELATVWQRCSGHPYALVLFSALHNLSALSPYYLLNSPAYAILWEGNVIHNLTEAVVGLLNPVQLSLVRALCLFREAAPLAGIGAVMTGKWTGPATDRPLVEQDLRNLLKLGLVTPNSRYDGETGYQLHPLLTTYLLTHYLDSEQRKANSYAASSLGVANQPAPMQNHQEERQIALAAGHMRVADYYERVAQQICPPPGLRGGPNDVTPLLAMLEHRCLGWHWQSAYDQFYALKLDEDLVRWGMWHTLIRSYELMLPPVGSLQRRDEGLACSLLGMAYGKLGEFDQSLAYFTSALAIQRDMGDQRGEALTLTNQGELLRAQGYQEQARQNFEQAFSLIQPQSNPELACILTHNMALLAQQQGNFPQSLRYFQQALQMARQSQNRERESLILTNLGLLLCQQQRYQEGLALLFPALQMRSAVHDASATSLTSFLHKLEQSMGDETFATLCQTAQAEGAQEQVLRVLAQ